MSVEVYEGLISGPLLEDASRAAWEVIAEVIASKPQWWHPKYAFVSAYVKHPTLLALAGRMPGADVYEIHLQQSPQTLAMLPSSSGVPYDPHVDEIRGAEGRTFATIVGLHLTDAGDEDGCFRYWDDGREILVPTRPGDVTVMTGDTLHGAGGNLGLQPRVAVYWRFLAPE